MIHFIEDIFIGLLSVVSVVILGLLLYELLSYYAKQRAELEMQAQREELQKKTEDIKAQQRNLAEIAQRAQKENNALYANVLKRQKDAELALQKAAEIRMNAEKIKAAADIKLQQLQKENKKLQGDLIAARQRAKRLAKKSERGA